MRAPSPLATVDPESAGPFLLLGRLAAGGMGEVYLGREAGRPDSLVAVKLLRRDVAHDPAFRERFAAEVRASFRVAERPATVTHVARVVAADVDGDPAWLATEFVPGPDVAEATAERPLQGPRLLEVARALAEALAALHAEGLVHGDVKPANVVLGPDGVRLVDLGLAHEVALEPSGPTFGSLGWSPPEHGRRPSGPWSDVYGWGLTVAYAATGTHPFGPGPAEVLARRMRSTGPALTGVPSWLGDAVAAALALEPGARPSAAELAARLAMVSVPPVTPTGGSHLPGVEDHATSALGSPTSVDLLLDQDDGGTPGRSWLSLVGVLAVVVACVALWATGTRALQPSSSADPGGATATPAASVPASPTSPRPTATPQRPAHPSASSTPPPGPSRHAHRKHGKHDG